MERIGKAERAAADAAPHDIILEGRGRLSATGVQRVLFCEPERAALETSAGVLHIAGAGLSVTALDLEKGKASLAGRFDAMEYTRSGPSGGLLRRLLR